MIASEVKLIPCKFEDLSSLEYSLFTCDTISWSEFQQFKCLVIRFSGECGKGTANSRGGFDRFMCGIIKGAMEAWKPVAVVLDLRDLKYEWGDEMSAPLGACGFFAPSEMLLRSIFEVYPELVHSDLKKLEEEHWDFPLSVVVSEKNKTGLTSLVTSEIGKKPGTLLFETLEEAVASVDLQLQKIFKKRAASSS